jgi:uncharacterized protein YdhG (YjbR/CyaY superfamily)
MFKAVKATTIKEYFDQLPPDRRETLVALDTFIKKVAPTLKPHFAYNMLGYGSFKYKNNKKELLDWPTVGVANQKNYISVYVCAVQNGEYVAEKHQKELGKVSVGKSCIRFKTLEDLDLKTFEKVLKIAEKDPGLQGVGASKN